MAKIPEARSGLVFRYRYLRVWQYQGGEQVGKDRPCCILLPLKPGQEVVGAAVYDEAGRSATTRHIAGRDDVLIVLIQSDPPGTDQVGLELSLEDKRHIGLPADSPSNIIVSEVNLDRWPNGDMSLVPGRQTSFTYNRPVPGPTLSRIMKAFLRVVEAKKVMVLVRQR